MISELLGVSLADNLRVRLLQSDGTYVRPKPARPRAGRRSQFEFIERAQTANANTKSNGSGRSNFPRVKLAARPF